MKRAMRATALSKKITLVVTAFVLAVSSLTASVPFIMSQRASALESVNTVTSSNVTADSMTLNFNIQQSLLSSNFEIVPGAASGSFDVQVDDGPINNYAFPIGSTEAPFSGVASFVQVREEFIADDYSFVKGEWQKFYVLTDTTAPSAPTITAPGARTWHRTAPIKTTWTAVSDPSGVSSYQVAYKYDDGHSFSGSSCVGETIDGDAVYCRSTSSTSRNHSPSPSEQGGVAVWVRAIDGAGNVGAWSTPVHYYYDATAPATSIAIDGLVDNTVDNTFTVSGDATDNLGLNRVYVQLVSRVDGKRYGGTTVNLIPFGTSHHWEQDFNATALGLPEGPVAAHVQVVDMAGNTASAGWTDDFIVDSTAPSLSVDANPVEGATVSGGQVTITGTAESADFGWYRYQLLDANKDPLTFSINGGSAPVVNGTLGSINIDSLPAGAFEGQALADGTYYVRVWAQDKYGNQVGTKNTPYIAQFTVLRTPTPGTGEEAGGGTTTPPPTDTEEEEESDGGDSDGVPQTFATPAAINPGAIAGVLGDSTDNTSNDGGNAANGGDVKGTSTEKNLAQAVDTDSSDGTVLGMAWYWWLLIVAAVAAVIWWIVAAIRGRNGEN